MQEVEKYIFLFLVGTTVLNLLIVITARFITGIKEFNLVIWYWVAALSTYVVSAVLSQTEDEIAFASFSLVVPIFFLSKILMDSRGIRFNWKFYSSAFSLGAGLSTYLILFTDVGFTVSLLPVNFCISLPMWEPALNALVTQRRESNWIEKAMAVLFLIGIGHNFDYVFFRLDQDAAWWGWSLSLGIYQCLAVFMLLLVSHRREYKERHNVETALNKLSGLSSNFNLEIDELYQKLETHITLKDELNLKLQRANIQLHEEREMNEMLIKTISHDLANPLTVVNAYAEMLHSGKIAEEEKNAVWQRLKISTRSALDMIYRIRNAIITRNQANFITLSSVSIDRAVKRIIDMFDTRLKEKNIKLIYTNSNPLALFVSAEEDSLTDHVLCNLLSNAMKFSYQGDEIHLRVTEKESFVELEVQDFGCGIEGPRLKKRLLDSTQGTKGEEGSGFGIMVMGYFVRKFGGSYEINSSKDPRNLGTTVLLRLKKVSTVEDFDANGFAHPRVPN
ncbi:MAG TPA: HAMP domain-containing sensor histidine kinase [Bacteriovoracaceae bacterium]|nr:HAMP domain-containing sensor histidine kinase [Bacteriovoracaceae bacterium]